MDQHQWLKNYSFSPVIQLPAEYYIHDFTQGYDPAPQLELYSVGRYNEVRKNMYTSPQFLGEAERNIHMGIDIAAPVGENIYSFYDGEIIFFGNNQNEGDYGPTLIFEHHFEQHKLYSLYGHLSLDSIENKVIGQTFKAGDTIARIGEKSVNGGWFPHLHFQLSLKKPNTHNIPGVVSKQEHQQALKDYPDPRWVLGPLHP